MTASANFIDKVLDAAITIEAATAAELRKEIEAYFADKAPASVALASAPTATTPRTATEVASAEKPKAEKPAPTPAPAAAASTAPARTPAPSPQQAAAAPAGEAVPYATLQKAVFELAAKDKPKVMALIERFGVKSFKDLDASKYAEALAAVNAAMEALAVPA